MIGLSQWFSPKPRRVSRGDVFAALDIGSSKVVCFIARGNNDGASPRVIGIGHQSAHGIKNGAVTNLEALQKSISAAVATAEEMAGEMIDRVTVNVSGPLLSSTNVTIELPLHGRDVTDSDLQRIILQAHNMLPDDTSSRALELIHTLPTDYVLDQQKGIRDPIGMTGHTLTSYIHLVAAAFGPVRTLITAIARCHLGIERLVAAPYASGLSCLVDDEMDLGCLVIDMGAGTTSFSIFFDGTLHYADGIPLGGAHITSDIARGLTTPLIHAERLKTLFGNALPSSMDERDIMDVPTVGEDGPDNVNHIPKSHLIRIIQPRCEETFELLRARLNKCGVHDLAGRRVILTGGASQLPGIRELAQRILDKQVRLGRPLRVTRPLNTSNKGSGHLFSGLAEATTGPSFATTAGLLAIAMNPDLAASSPALYPPSSPHMLSRIGQWMRQSL